VEETHSYSGQCVSFSLIDVGSDFTAYVVFLFLELRGGRPLPQSLFYLLGLQHGKISLANAGLLHDRLMKDQEICA